MKKWTRKTINGVTFELNEVDKVTYHTFLRRDLWDCYGRPSTAKENIYREWSRWFTDLDSFDFTIPSYNSNFFTIEGYFTFESVDYYTKITPSHNYLFMVE